MEVVGFLIGAGIIAVSPLVPALRPVAKAAVKGGLAVADMSKGVTAAAVYQWSEVVSEAGAEVAEEHASASEDKLESAEVAAARFAEGQVAEASATTTKAATGGAADEDDKPKHAVGSPKTTLADDDLKEIDGIGPKVEKLLQWSGIRTYAHLAEADPDELRQLLLSAGGGYRALNPQSWPEQAKELMAA